MKLNEIADSEPMLYSMLLKLVEKGQPVYVDAHSRTFKTGPMNGPFQDMRSKSSGWLMQYSRTGESPTASLRWMFKANDLHISSYKEYAMTGGGGVSHGSSFLLELPVDENYTLRKIDGTWTIVDRKAVNEEEKKIPLVWSLAKKQRYDKKKRVSVSAYFEGAVGNYKHLHGELMEIKDDEAWINMDRRTYVVKFTDTDDLYLTLKKDPYSDFYWIVNTEAGKKADAKVHGIKEAVRDRDQEEFILSLALKAFKNAGLHSTIEHTAATGAPHIISSFAGFTIATHYDSATSTHPWLNAWFKHGTRAAPIQHFKSYKDALADIVGLRHEDQ